MLISVHVLFLLVYVSLHLYFSNKIKQGFCLPNKSKAHSALTLTYNKGICCGFIITALINIIFLLIK